MNSFARFLIAALTLLLPVALPAAPQGGVTLIRSSVEPLPNCTPAVQGQQEPMIWDITAGLMKVCTGTNTWTTLGGGGGATQSFTSIINGINNQAQMTVGTGASLLTSGSGTIAATSAPFAGLSSGTNNSAVMVIDTGASLAPANSGVLNANQIAGTTVPVNSAADQALLTTASATGGWKSLPGCLDAGGNHLNYNTSTHAFSCGTSGGTAGSAAFNTITGGTNASAAMLVGTGASLGVSGSGTIAATSAPFAGLSSGTNTTAALVLGTGASLGTSGSGINNANQLSGTTVPASSAADQYLGTTASGTGQWAGMPACLDAGGNHLNYNTTTHAFACGTSGGTAGSAAFNTITNGTNTQAAMLVGTGASLAATGSGTIAATSALFAGLTSGTNTALAGVLGTGASLTISGSGTINANILNGTTIPASSAANQAIVTTASGVGAWAALPSCLDSGGNHLNYNTATHSYFCGTSTSGGGGGGGGGSVTTFSAGTLAPLFTTSVANAASTPALSFTLTSAAANSVFANCTGSPAAPAYCSITAAMQPTTTVNSVVNDTNVTGSIAAQALTLGWTGTLAKVRTLATTVYTDQANTFSAGLQDFTAATMKIPSSAGAAPTVNAQIAYDTTAGRYMVGLGAASRVLPWFASGIPTNLQCATWTGTLGQLASTACLTGTLNTAQQFALAYYSGAGVNNVLSGIAAPTGVNNVPQFVASTPVAGVGTLPVFTVGGVAVTAVVITSDAIVATDRGHRKTYNNGGATAVTIAQAGSTGFDQGFVVVLKNKGAGTVTLTPATSTINGVATLVLVTNRTCFIYLDSTGTQYESSCFLDS